MIAPLRMTESSDGRGLERRIFPRKETRLQADLLRLPAPACAGG